MTIAHGFFYFSILLVFVYNVLVACILVLTGMDAATHYESKLVSAERTKATLVSFVNRSAYLSRSRR